MDFFGSFKPSRGDHRNDPFMLDVDCEFGHQQMDDIFFGAKEREAIQKEVEDELLGGLRDFNPRRQRNKRIEDPVQSDSDDCTEIQYERDKPTARFFEDQDEQDSQETQPETIQAPVDVERRLNLIREEFSDLMKNFVAKREQDAKIIEAFRPTFLNTVGRGIDTIEQIIEANNKLINEEVMAITNQMQESFCKVQEADQDLKMIKHNLKAIIAFTGASSQ